MNRVALFGVGNNWRMNKRKYLENYNIVVLVDNDELKQGKTDENIEIISPKKLNEFEYDEIVLTTDPQYYKFFYNLVKDGVRFNHTKVTLMNGKSFTLNTINYEQEIVRFEYKNLNFDLSAYSDYFVLEEVFIHGSYNVHLADKDYVLIDIGSNIGLTSLFFAQKPCIKQIYGFEPFLKTIQRSYSNLQLNPEIASKITLSQFGLGKKDEKKYIHYNDARPGSMSTVIDRFADDNNNYEEIEIRNTVVVLTPIFEKHAHQDIAIKIDCEGAEYEILEQLETSKLLSKVKVIILEYHGNQNKKEIEGRLSRSGFIFKSDEASVEFQEGMMFGVNVN